MIGDVLVGGIGMLSSFINTFCSWPAYENSVGLQYQLESISY